MQPLRCPPALAEDGKLPFGLSNLAAGLAKALESVLDGAYPGQIALMEEAEAALRADERATQLLGSDLTLGEIDAKASMSVTAGVQIMCECTGSRGAGTVTIGGARLDEEDGGGLSLQLLRLESGNEDIYVVEP